jgi:hypothetical protein
VRVAPRALAAGLAVLALIAFGVAFGVTRSLEDGGDDAAGAGPSAAVSAPEAVTLADQRIPRLDPLGTLPPLRRRPPPPVASPVPEQSAPTPAVTPPTQPTAPPTQTPPAPDTGVEDFE